jgi:hypothetical protein
VKPEPELDPFYTFLKNWNFPWFFVKGKNRPTLSHTPNTGFFLGGPSNYLPISLLDLPGPLVT